MSMTFVLVLLQASTELAADVIEMDAFSWGFMLVSMTAVVGLTIYCYSRILGGKEHFDPDGTGPAHAPEPGEVEKGKRP